MFDKGETYKKGDLVEDTDLPEKTRRLGIILKVEPKEKKGWTLQYLHVRWQGGEVEARIPSSWVTKVTQKT